MTVDEGPGVGMTGLSMDPEAELGIGLTRCRWKAGWAILGLCALLMARTQRSRRGDRFPVAWPGRPLKSMWFGGISRVALVGSFCS